MISWALIFVSILFGSFLRLYKLDLLSYWSDELATIYFAKYPSRIYSEETHPFGFYLLIRPVIDLFGANVTVIRYAVAILSVSLNLYLCIYARKIFSHRGWALFTVILFLLPFEIAFARMARMYSLFFSLALWFYLLLIKEPSSKKVPLLSFLMTIIFPVGFLPGFVAGSLELIKSKTISKKVIVLYLSVIPSVLYYLSKFIFLERNPLTDYAGSDQKMRPLILDFFYSLGGEYYPKIVSNPMPFDVLVIMILLAVFCLSAGVLKRVKNKVWDRNFDYSLSLIIFSFIFFKLFGLFVINIEVGRYLIFLAPFIIIHATTWSEILPTKWGDMPGVAIFFVLLLSLLQYSPLSVYEGEREALKQFEHLRKLHPGDVVVCANKFQYEYHFKMPRKDCIQEMRRISSEKRDFVFLDINGSSRFSLIELSKEYDIYDYRFIYLSTIAWARPKENRQVGKP